ncbi:uncharacterized protein ISCGN_014380 [Ixodes scapularis]
MCPHDEKPASPVKRKFAEEDDEESQDSDSPQKRKKQIRQSLELKKGIMEVKFIHCRLAVRDVIDHLDKHLVIIVVIQHWRCRTFYKRQLRINLAVFFLLTSMADTEPFCCALAQKAQFSGMGLPCTKELQHFAHQNTSTSEGLPFKSQGTRKDSIWWYLMAVPLETHPC